MSSRIIIATLFLSTLSFIGVAQRSVGIKGGLNYVNIVPTDNYEGYIPPDYYRFGFHIGVTSSFRLFDNFYLCPELLYSNKGSKFPEEPSYTPSNAGSLHFNYLNLLLSLEWRFSDVFGLAVGPELGYLLYARRKLKGDDAIKMSTNDLDIGISGTLNFKVSTKVIVNLRYINGISAIDGYFAVPRSQSGFIPVREVNYINSTFQLSISYIVFK